MANDKDEPQSSEFQTFDLYFDEPEDKENKQNSQLRSLLFEKTPLGGVYGKLKDRSVQASNNATNDGTGNTTDNAADNTTDNAAGNTTDNAADNVVSNALDSATVTNGTNVANVTNTIQDSNDTKAIKEVFDHKAFLKTVPNRPGSYRMYDSTDTVIYVGKAKDLKKRLSSYFLKHGQSSKTQALVSHIARIEFTVTFSESEALILENELIKQYQPRYNILLRDDKTYPYILLTAKHQHPGVYYHRGAKRKIGEYYGPFPDSNAVRESLRLLQRLFPVRQCEDSVYAHRSRPCLMAQMKRCLAPCVPMSPEEEQHYQEQVSLLRLFLKGQNQSLLKTMAQKMEEHAEKLEFEAAALLRDQITALRRVQESNSIISDVDYPLDVIGHYMQDGLCCIHVLFIRQGRLLGSRSFFPKMSVSSDESHVLFSFLTQFYLNDAHAAMLPEEVLLDCNLQSLVNSAPVVSQDLDSPEANDSNQAQDGEIVDVVNADTADVEVTANETTVHAEPTTNESTANAEATSHEITANAVISEGGESTKGNDALDSNYSAKTNSTHEANSANNETTAHVETTSNEITANAVISEGGESTKGNNALDSNYSAKTNGAHEVNSANTSQEFTNSEYPSSKCEVVNKEEVAIGKDHDDGLNGNAAVTDFEELSTTEVEDSVDLNVLVEAIQSSFSKKLRFSWVARGAKARYVKLAQANAQVALQSKISSQSTALQRIADLERLLGISEVERMECYDISHTMGENTVASCVVFGREGPDPSRYRRYNIHDITPGDDFAAMHQVLSRRFRDPDNGELPQLIFIDGGAGQLEQAEKVLTNAFAHSKRPMPMIVAVAKGEGRKEGLETLIIGFTREKIHLSLSSTALQLVIHIRNESHRFAITGHRAKRAKARTTSRLESIPGVGPKRRQALLQHLGGMQEVIGASISELQKVPGISLELAKKIYDELHSL